MIPRLVFALLLGSALALSAKPSAPEWLQQAAATPLPTAFDKKTKAAILLREIVYELRDDHQLIATERVAIRILQPEGQKHARASASYYVDTDKVRASLAWLIPPQGDVIPYAKKDFIEVTPTDHSLYNDTRSLYVSASGNAVTGATFGYEITIEGRATFGQLLEPLQGALPIVNQRISVRLPKTWTLKPTFINCAPLAPVVQGPTTLWTIPAQPALPDEPSMPGTRRFAAFLGLDLLNPSASDARAKILPRFSSWADVSVYFSRLDEAACIVDAAITAKANELSRTATSLIEIIRALGRFTQKVSYVSIAANLGRGGGYEPRPAPLTLKRNFGDCKDKATLLRALLRVKGIAAYPVSISVGDEQAIWPEWPSPFQFNHAILAIAAPADLVSSAIVDHPTLGRLLIFDPTSENVPLGELPSAHYRSQVLLEAGADGGMISLPPLPEGRNTVRRTITATLDDRGALTARVSEENQGRYAVIERQDKKDHTPEAYQKSTTSWINSGIRNAKVSNLSTEDRFEENTFTLSLDLAAPYYAQAMRAKLLVFKPAFLSRRRGTSFTEETRTQPVVFAPGRIEETATIQLPPSFAVDELPKPIELTTPFARYRSICTKENDQLKVSRTLEYFSVEVPVADYPSVRRFFDQIIRADQASAVLQRRPAPAAVAPSKQP